MESCLFFFMAGVQRVTGLFTLMAKIGKEMRVKKFDSVIKICLSEEIFWQLQQYSKMQHLPMSRIVRELIEKSLPIYFEKLKQENNERSN